MTWMAHRACTRYIHPTKLMPGAESQALSLPDHHHRYASLRQRHRQAVLNGRPVSHLRRLFRRRTRRARLLGDGTFLCRMGKRASEHPRPNDLKAPVRRSTTTCMTLVSRYTTTRRAQPLVIARYQPLPDFAPRLPRPRAHFQATPQPT